VTVQQMCRILALLPQFAHRPALDAPDRRVGGAQQERVADAHADKPLTDDARLKRLDIDGDVRQLRNAGQHSTAAGRGSTPPPETRRKRLCMGLFHRNGSRPSADRP
jgi:hypothetical protein